MSGAQSNLADLADKGLTWAHLATVDSLEKFQGRWLVNCTIQPEGRPIQARLVVLGLGAGRGVLLPVEVGDEVLVVCPDGDSNKAVAIPSLASKPAPVPPEWAGDRIWFLHPGGTEIRATTTGPVQAVVVTSFLDAFSGILDDLITVATAAGAAAPNAVALKTALEGGAHRSTALKTE